MRKIFFMISCLTLMCISCKKNWLDEKRDIKLIVPTTLADLRLLLNNGITLPLDHLGVGELSSGDFYIGTEYWKTQTPDVRGAYIWNGVFKGTQVVTEWDGSYAQIEICNVVLDAIEKIVPTSLNQEELNDIKGAALFFRAKAFFNLASLFALPYSEQNLSLPGVHLRLSSDINIEVRRSTIADTYQQIVKDLKLSADLVRIMPANKEGVSKPAVYAQLARTYLIMGDYISAQENANACLQYYSSLLNYNTLKSSDTYPFKRYNIEVILSTNIVGNYAAFFAPNGKIDPELYKSYADNDLRKTLFFVLNTADKTYSFRGMYLGLRGLFSGIATDELYLIKAECAARLGDAPQAMKVLNELLVTRFVSGTYTDLHADTPEAALALILRERRKELLLRGLRWNDLRRLNLNSATTTTLKRTVDNKEYLLAPNDKRYAFPLPDYVISSYGLEQNIGW